MDWGSGLGIGGLNYGFGIWIGNRDWGLGFRIGMVFGIYRSKIILELHVNFIGCGTGFSLRTWEPT